MGKIAVLHEIKDFRKGIHELQWNNQRLDLEEEDLLQRTRDLQLLRVTKSLQSVIKGGGDVNDTQETAKLDKLYHYQVNAHKARVAEKLKTVQALQAQVRSCHKENLELDDDIFALESAVGARAAVQVAGRQPRAAARRRQESLRPAAPQRQGGRQDEHDGDAPQAPRPGQGADARDRAHARRARPPPRANLPVVCPAVRLTPRCYIAVARSGLAAYRLS